MVRVSFASSEGRDLAGGAESLVVEADTVRRLIAELERLRPGLGDYVERRAAIAIDGEIHQDALFAALAPGAEVFVIPRIGGG
jgi:molybdopterin converting factor small subunit